MSAQIVPLFPAQDGTGTVGELIDKADSLPTRRLRSAMLRAAKAVGEFPLKGEPTAEELRQLVTLGALLTRYVFGRSDGDRRSGGYLPTKRDARI